VGVTKRSIQERFRKYPEYLLLEELSLGYFSALEYEKYILDITLNYRYTPTDNIFVKEGGFTECFKLDEIIETTQELIDSIQKVEI
jgi:hypothetical protein